MVYTNNRTWIILEYLGFQDCKMVLADSRCSKLVYDVTAEYMTLRFEIILEGNWPDSSNNYYSLYTIGKLIG